MSEISVWALFFIVYSGVMWIMILLQLRKLQRGKKTTPQAVAASVTLATAPPVVATQLAVQAAPAVRVAPATVTVAPSVRKPTLIRQWYRYYIDGVAEPFATLPEALGHLPTSVAVRVSASWRDLPSSVREKIRREELSKGK